MSKLYYTVNYFQEEGYEGFYINVYQMQNNEPILVLSLERDFDWSEYEQIESHFEDEMPEEEYEFIQL